MKTLREQSSPTFDGNLILSNFHTQGHSIISYEFTDRQIDIVLTRDVAS